jgi:AAA domain, putative AbiEii toxin, Type IV TA system
MLPLTALEVARYRGLRDFSLRGLGRVNLLVGPNNSGKTSVLEAISLAAAPLDPFGWIRVATRRESLLSAWMIGERLRWLFPQHASKGPDASYDGSIQLSMTGRSPFRALDARFQDLRSAIEASPTAAGMHDAGATGDEPELSAERRGTRIDVEVTSAVALGPGESSAKLRESFTWWAGERFVFEKKDAPALRTHVIAPNDHWYSDLPAMYSEARVEGAGEAALDVARLLSLIDPRIVGLEILAARTMPIRRAAPDAVLYLRDRDAGLLPVDAFGDGMRRILLMAFGVTRARGGVLLIDEIETAIHVSALGHVFRWIVAACAASDVQLFVTTHSLEAIDAILAADTTPDEDIVGYRLDPTGTNVIAHRYGEDLLKRLRLERGADVR